MHITNLINVINIFQYLHEITNYKNDQNTSKKTHQILQIPTFSDTKFRLDRSQISFNILTIPSEALTQ